MRTDPCSACSRTVDEQAHKAQAARDLLDGSLCSECIRSVKSNPQLTDLLEQIEEALNATNAEMWREHISESDRILFAAKQLANGNVEGGSPGFVDHLNRYVALKEHEAHNEVSDV